MASVGHIGAWIEKHPFLTAGAVFLGGAVLIYIYYSGGSTTATGSTADANYAAGLNAQVQLAGIEAQYGAQTAVAQAQAGAVADQVNGQVSIAQTQANAAVQEATLAEQLGITSANAQADIQKAGIAAQQAVDINAQNNATVQYAAAQTTAQYLATTAASTTDYQTEAQSLMNSELISTIGFLGAYNHNNG